MNFIKKNRTLFVNFSSLTALQISNYIFPLITFPYLVRVLGPEKYGLVNFAAAFAAYFGIITNYGFNLSATREISVMRDNAEQLSRKFWNVLFTKFFLFVVSLPFFFAVVISFDKFSSQADVYFLSLLAVFGAIFFPDWFFQGVEKMKAIAVINVAVKILWTASIFIFVKNETDILVLIFLNGLSFLISGIVGMFFAVKTFSLKFVLPNFRQIREELENGWHVFLSTISISLYTTSNVFILGLIAGDAAVGYYTAADKIRTAVQGLFGNAGQTIYPYSARLFSENLSKAASFLHKYLKAIFALLLPVTLMIFIFAEPITTVLLGGEFQPSINVLRILAFLPFLIALSNVYGIQVMLNTGYKKEFTRVVFVAGIINVILALLLTFSLREIGTAIAVLIAESYVTFAMWKFVKKKRLI